MGRPPRGRAPAASSEHVFTPARLVLVIGVQYVVGGLIALGWTQLPSYDGAPWLPIVHVLGTLACVVGIGLTVLSRSPSATPRTLGRAAHASIVLAQVVVTGGYALTQDARSPVLLFLLWTTAYAGIFSRRARWTHAAVTTALLTAACLTMPERRDALVEWVFLLATVAVVTVLVSRMTERLHFEATHDALTRLPNRRLLHGAIAAALSRTRQAPDGGTVAVLLLDLDRFKNVNDSFGHAVGDALLQGVAARLRDVLQPSDVIARLGGDEFAILREDPRGFDGHALWDRLRTVWQEPVPVGDRRLYVDGTVGLVVATATDTPETLLRDADTAMYEAKAAGGGCWRAFDPHASGRSERLVALESGLREAVARDELALHYQPVMSLSAGRPQGAEGLLRWTSPELGPVGPDEFIEVAEKCGLIESLGAWALDRALRDLAALRSSGAVHPTFQVAVNISAHQLTEDLPEQVVRLLARHGVPAGNLALEVTESAMMTGDTPGVVLGRLHDVGVVLMLDDFGTGHSSLSHLRRHPLDVVKIDRSFVSAMCLDSDDRALVLGVLSLAHALGKTVVAEGIEDAEQLRALRAAGCDAGQGYLLSRPVPLERLVDALAAAEAAFTDAPAVRPAALA